MNELWVEKYRPKTVRDLILPKSLKNIFQGFVDQKKIPNLILAGSSGVGKTTAAKAMAEEIGADCYILNASNQRNIDTLRNEITDFASTVSFLGGRKYLILDEADYLNANSTQPALRNFMEEFSDSCGFIMTCNSKQKIIKPLHSRAAVIDFTIPKDERLQMAVEMEQRLKQILQYENITVTDGVLVPLIKKYFPDMRRMINELQAYAVNGTIDAGILVQTDSNLTELFKFLKDRDWLEMRKWCAKNVELDMTTLVRGIYDASSKFEPASLPSLILILGEWQYKAAFSADPEIAMVACLSEIMAECKLI